MTETIFCKQCSFCRAADHPLAVAIGAIVSAVNYSIGPVQFPYGCSVHDAPIRLVLQNTWSIGRSGALLCCPWGARASIEESY